MVESPVAKRTAHLMYLPSASSHICTLNPLEGHPHPSCGQALCCRRVADRISFSRFSFRLWTPPQ